MGGETVRKLYLVRVCRRVPGIVQVVLYLLGVVIRSLPVLLGHDKRDEVQGYLGQDVVFPPITPSTGPLAVPKKKEGNFGETNPKKQYM